MTFRKDLYQKQLKELRNKLAAEHMSLLVGSGLSKNVSPKFLTWDELLVDLAYELNSRAIDAAYERYTANPSANPKSKEDFIRDECIYLIRQQGYLEIVSDYIKRKGIPESITTYIEERIPAVSRIGDRYFIETNGKTDEFPRELLALHKGLIDLPWNNIYTTNYDDLLDICIDETRYDRLSEEIRLLEIEISDIEDQIRTKGTERESLSVPSEKPDAADAALTPSEALVPLSPDEQKVKNLIGKLNLEIRQLKAQQQQKELLMVEKSLEADKSYKVVKSADGLRIKKLRNIIKLHGSLRSKADQAEFDFGFDGDHKKQYVISKEDYDTYPTRHEAFTQLMRISLLQESFCLVGFSGVDPNFLQWINWVRDILYKAARRKSKGYKIYLIDVEEGEVSSDKQLFYENHNIVRIPMRDPDVLLIFQEELGTATAITDRRTAIETLIAYLGNDENIKPDIPTADVSIRKEHKQIWDSIQIHDHNIIPDEASVASLLERLQSVNKQVWLPDLNFRATHNQHSLISYVSMASWSRELSNRPKLRRLTMIALRDLAVPIRSFLEADVIELLANEEENQTEVARAISRNDALSANLEPELENTHDELLRLAYTFQFELLHRRVEQWQASGRQQIVKAGILGIFDRQAAVNLLSSMITNNALSGGEEQLYALEMLSHITQPFIFGNDKRTTRLITAYQRSGYRGLQERINLLQKEVVKKISKLEPYGAKRMQRTRTIQLTKHSEAEAAVQMIMLLAESGFQLTVNNIYLISSEDWYLVMKEGFEFYPFPFLFYSLQHSNKDFLKKAGQEYAFSEATNVTEQLPAICSALFSGLPHFPEAYADHTQIFLSSLLIGVDPTIWQADFSKWWSRLLEQGIAFQKNHLFTHPSLVTAGIQYIADTKILEAFVGDCLDAAMRGEDEQAINFLYYINRNQHFKKIQRNTVPSPIISDKLDKVIDGLDTTNLSRIFVLGNLYRMLSKRQLNRINDLLLSVDFEKIKIARIWRILVHFANGQEELGKRIRKVLVEHRNLWYTGIEGTTIRGGLNDEPISVSALSYSDLNLIGLHWDDAEFKVIFERLQAELEKLERVSHMRDTWFSFTPVLEEMVDFLLEFKDRLKQYPEFAIVLPRAKQRLDWQRNYSELEDGLTSHDETTVETAIRELDVRIYRNSFDPENITLVLNKILLQAEPAVETALRYIASWLYYKRSPATFREQQTLLVRILRKYETQPLANADVAFVEEKLIRIAWLLNSWSNTDLAVSKWLEKGQISHFNNVRQFMASVAAQDNE